MKMGFALDVAGISIFSEHSIGISLAALTGGSTPSSAAWPAANDAIFVPFAVPKLVTAGSMFVGVGNTIAGHMDVGIYTLGGTKLASSGSTLQSSTQNLQQLGIGSGLELSAGRYYMAIALNNVTGTVFRANLTVTRLQQLGVAKMASAFPLPATASLVTVTSGLLPFLGIGVEGVA